MVFPARGVYDTYPVSLSSVGYPEEMPPDQHVSPRHLSVTDLDIEHGRCARTRTWTSVGSWVSTTTENFSPGTQNGNYSPTNPRRTMTSYNVSASDSWASSRAQGLKRENGRAGGEVNVGLERQRCTYVAERGRCDLLIILPSPPKKTRWCFWSPLPQCQDS